MLIFSKSWIFFNPVYLQRTAKFYQEDQEADSHNILNKELIQRLPLLLPSTHLTSSSVTSSIGPFFLEIKQTLALRSQSQDFGNV